MAKIITQRRKTAPIKVLQKRAQIWLNLAEKSTAVATHLYKLSFYDEAIRYACIAQYCLNRFHEIIATIMLSKKQDRLYSTIGAILFSLLILALVILFLTLKHKLQ